MLNSFCQGLVGVSHALMHAELLVLLLVGRIYTGGLTSKTLASKAQKMRKDIAHRAAIYTTKAFIEVFSLSSLPTRTGTNGGTAE
jgi:hypothetical protein